MSTEDAGVASMQHLQKSRIAAPWAKSPGRPGLENAAAAAFSPNKSPSADNFF
jgi:hypothetical protein